jgi:hypothetical protein
MTAASMAARAPGLDESPPHKTWTVALASLGMFIVALVRSKAGRSAGPGAWRGTSAMSASAWPGVAHVPSGA